MDLDSLKYADLQHLAKSVGLKANVKVSRDVCDAEEQEICFMFRFSNVTLMMCLTLLSEVISHKGTF